MNDVATYESILDMLVTYLAIAGCQLVTKWIKLIQLDTGYLVTWLPGGNFYMIRFLLECLDASQMAVYVVTTAECVL